jgi:hypothetical protein
MASSYTGLYNINGNIGWPIVNNQSTITSTNDSTGVVFFLKCDASGNNNNDLQINITSDVSGGVLYILNEINQISDFSQNTVLDNVLEANILVPNVTKYITISNNYINAGNYIPFVFTLLDNSISIPFQLQIEFLTTNNDSFSCFLSNTKILMIDGTYKKISEIRKGDMVRGLSGRRRKVLHAGYVNFIPEKTELDSLPRHVTPHYFGRNLPKTDLYLSGGHSIIMLKSDKYKTQFEETQRETQRTTTLPGFKKLMSKKISDFEIIKTTNEIKNITGHSPRYYHIVIDDLSDAMIANGLPVESISTADFISQGFIEN